MRELMPRTPFLLPGVGAQGGDVADLAPAFAPGPRGRPGHRLALDRQRARGQRAATRAAAARAEAERLRERGLGARLKPPDPPLSSAPMAASQPRALPGAARARGLRCRPLHGRDVLADDPEGTAPPNRSARRPAPRRRHGDARAQAAGAATRSRRATRRRRSPRRPACRSTDILRLNPDLDPQTLSPGQRIKLASEPRRDRRSRRWSPPPCARRSRPAARRRATARRSVKAPNAIVLEVSTGEVACERAADARRPVGSAVKLMTALLTLERADLSDTLHRLRLPAAAAESQIGLLPGERMTRARPAARPAARVRQRRGDDARRRRRRVRARVRAEDEPPRARARADGHALRQPDRARRRRAPTPARATSSSSPLLLRTKPFFRRTVEQDARDARLGRRIRARSRTATTSCRRSRGSTASRPATRSAPATCSSAPARSNGIQVVSAVLGTPSEAARDADTLALLNCGRGRFQRITAAPAGTRVGVQRADPLPPRRRARASWSGPTGSAPWCPRGAARPRHGQADQLPDRGRGADRRRHAARRGRRAPGRPPDRHRAAGRRAPTSPAAGLAQRTKSWFTHADRRSCSPSPC